MMEYEKKNNYYGDLNYNETSKLLTHILMNEKNLKTFINICNNIELLLTKDQIFNKKNKKIYEVSNIEYSEYICYLSLFILRNLTDIELWAEESPSKEINKMVNSIVNNIYHLLIWKKKYNQWNYCNIFFFIKKNIKDELRLFLSNIIIYLIDIKVLEETLIKICTNGFKTHRYVFLNENNYEVFFKPDINYSPFTIYEDLNNVYLIGNHYSLIYDVFKYNKKSGNQFEFSDINKLKKFNNSFFIDEKLFSENIEYYKKENKIIENPSKLFHEVNQAYIAFLKENNKEGIKKSMQTLSIINNIIKWESLFLTIDFSKKIYIPTAFDFRGRFYYASSTNITNDKIIRFCIHDGMYSDAISKEINIEGEYTKKFNKIIREYADKITKIDNAASIRTDWFKECIIWNLISIAEVFKTSLLPSPVSIETLIDKGISVFIKQISYDPIKYDFDKFIKINLHVTIIKEMINWKYKKWIVSKDCTGSVFQITGKVLGWKDDECFKYSNMSDNYNWYDPYTYISHKCINYDELKKYFTLEQIKKITARGPLKYVKMQTIYSAGREKVWEAYCDEINLNDFNDIQKQKIYEMVIDIHSKLNNEKIFFSKPLNEIHNTLKNNKLYIIKNIDNTTAYIASYKQIKKQKEITRKINSTVKRITIQKLENTLEIDNKAFKKSSRPNYIHSQDSALARWYVQRNGYFSIHDCYMIDNINQSHLVSEINIGMKIIFHDLKIVNNERLDKIESLFIVI